jgi:hypothetical protein
MSAYTDTERARALQELSDSINESISRNFRPLTEEEKNGRVNVAVNDKAEWQHSLLNQEDIDEIDDLLEVDPYVPNPPSRRSDRELSRVLAILDNINSGGTNP